MAKKSVKDLKYSTLCEMERIARTGCSVFTLSRQDAGRAQCRSVPRRRVGTPKPSCAR